MGGGLRVAIAAVLLAIIAACGSAQATIRYQSGQGAPGLKWDFDTDTAGGLPEGAEAFSGEWVVRAETDAPSPPNALCQMGNAQFPAVALSDAVYSDLTMSARFKPISGREDQAAGLIFRIQDKDNYYILRANALENNVNFYKCVGGRRSGLKESSITVPSGVWQELRVEAWRQQLRGFLNGELVVEVTDSTYAAGRVGLWTKADSVTCFDDVSVEPFAP